MHKNVFKIAPNWKQLKYPSTVELINQSYWVCIMEYYTKHWTKEVRVKRAHAVWFQFMKFKNKQNKSVATDVKRVVTLGVQSTWGVLRMFCFSIWVILCGTFTAENSSSCVLICVSFLNHVLFSERFFNKAALSENGLLWMATEQILWSPLLRELMQ